ncbi:extracellular serine-rich [Cordyceps militaris]|uniref:Extracellular serine-rich n=1 Tax=Cordyceps militaris TaxID=73501 RepID=A0A2H4SRH3_CORMI|nr:extracellular serine-rich [Cordyceps militaris]
MKFTLASVAALIGAAQEARAAINVQVVSVGRNPVNNVTGLKFWPEKIKAEPGSMVQFQFLAGNHTLTQSDFDHPCKPIKEVNPSALGIFSAYMPVAASAAKKEIPVFTVMVNDTKPMWFFCSQGPHCEKGMAMVINENTSANASRSIEEYKKLAAEAAPGGSTEGATPSAESAGTTPVGAASGSPSTGGASVASVSSSMLLALGAVFLLL